MSIENIYQGQEKVNAANEIKSIPIEHKFLLTIPEAAAYTNIGQNRISKLLNAANCPFVVFVGVKRLVKRKEFEEFISKALQIVP